MRSATSWAFARSRSRPSSSVAPRPVSDPERLTPSQHGSNFGRLEGLRMTKIESWKALEMAAAARILILDGAMGTMIQRRKLDEAGYRGQRFKTWTRDLKGNNDLLVLTQPEIVSDIHEAYLAAGADIIETNTFNAQRISMADYGMEEQAYEINLAAARIARAAADKWMQKTP